MIYQDCVYCPSYDSEYNCCFDYFTGHCLRPRVCTLCDSCKQFTSCFNCDCLIYCREVQKDCAECHIFCQGYSEGGQKFDDTESSA